MVSDNKNVALPVDSQSFTANNDPAANERKQRSTGTPRQNGAFKLKSTLVVETESSVFQCNSN
ncbi:hypothetical protein [Legionella cardiaca]|uniref:Uncharacterized protein n=1 Tax=Legionella cardiaca TaxID=1071983 RepID=A0ABY8AXR2_9GAMM|nr:hypothetical protein [Legionella cardiaca]WED44521.1 hypothetical protein PXX05_06970 [Legionella cardiaca]